MRSEAYWPRTKGNPPNGGFLVDVQGLGFMSGQAGEQADQAVLLTPGISRKWNEILQVYGADKVRRRPGCEGVPVACCTVERLMQKMSLRGVMRGKVVRAVISDRDAPCPLGRVNKRRLLEPIGYIPPAEAAANLLPATRQSRRVGGLI